MLTGSFSALAAGAVTSSATPLDIASAPSAATRVATRRADGLVFVDMKCPQKGRRKCGTKAPPELHLFAWKSSGLTSGNDPGGWYRPHIPDISGPTVRRAATTET